ncbi:unnamed protein product [Auanema sp. JU1783]|nr:unnamed protein product [Auanema sp. JU1783]
MLNIPGILDLLTKNEENFTTEDVVDQLNYGVTVYMLAFFALLTGSKQHFGNPIQCITPAESSDSWVNYYHDYCFIQEKFILKNWNFNNVKTDSKIINPKESGRVAYYQWVPYVLFLQALFFLTPRVIRKCLGNYFSKGCDFENVLSEAGRLKEKLGKERVETLKTLSHFISKMLKWKKTKSMFGGFTLTVNYVLCKVLLLLNSAGQWFTLTVFVGNGEYYWGFQVMEKVLTSVDVSPTDGFFPRIVQCSVNQADLASIHVKNMQCVLMLNYINEKIYVFLYFWLLVLTAANALALLRYALFLVFPSYRIRLINSLIPLQSLVPLSSTESFAKRVHKVLGSDGILLLLFVDKQAGGLITYEIAKQIFKAIAPTRLKASVECGRSVEDSLSNNEKIEYLNCTNERINNKWNETFPSCELREGGTFGGYERRPRASAPELSNGESNDSTLPIDSSLCVPESRGVIMVDNRFEMAARQMNMIEKLANSFGALYRHQKAQFPRRAAILRSVWKHELAPPKQADWPVIQKEWKALVQAVQTKTYRQYTVREAAVYGAVVLEILAWFFVGEMIGRRYVFGYLVASDYVSADTKKKAAEQTTEEKSAFIPQDLDIHILYYRLRQGADSGMHPSQTQTAAMDQQYYYASLPSHGSMPYQQYQTSYYPGEQQYVMAGHQQPIVIPMAQSYVYLPQPHVPATQQYLPPVYGAHPNSQQIYYENMYMHPPTTTLQNGQITHDSSNGSAGPLLTSTPLPTEYIAIPPPMTNQVPYADIRTAHMKYHKSMETDDVCLANVSNISPEADATICESKTHIEEVAPHRNSVAHPNYKTRMCVKHSHGKECDLRNKCPYAHGVEELRQSDQNGVSRVNPKYKTRLCKNFMSGNGTRSLCPYGLRCEFIHPTDKQFANLPINIRNSIAPSFLISTNPADVTPESIADYYPACVTRSAAKAAPEKILLKNRNVVGSMMCLTGTARKDDDSAICSGSSESGSSMHSARFRGRNAVPMPSKFSRRRSMSQQNMKKWNSIEAINTDFRA